MSIHKKRRYTLVPTDVMGMDKTSQSQLFDWISRYKIDPLNISKITLIPADRKVIFEVQQRDSFNKVILLPNNMIAVDDDVRPMTEYPGGQWLGYCSMEDA